MHITHINFYKAAGLKLDVPRGAELTKLPISVNDAFKAVATLLNEHITKKSHIEWVKVLATTDSLPSLSSGTKSRYGQMVAAFLEEKEVGLHDFVRKGVPVMDASKYVHAIRQQEADILELTQSIGHIQALFDAGKGGNGQITLYNRDQTMSEVFIRQNYPHNDNQFLPARGNALAQIAWQARQRRAKPLDANVA